MCKCCSVPQRQYWVFGCGAFLLLVALILGLLWPTLALNILYSRLTLEDGSMNYENWIETPIPIYMKITMFNWTNSDEVLNHDVKPVLAEMGPYVFVEHHKRVNVTWNENGTVTFNQIRTWEFVQGKSNGSLDDVVTNLNVISSSVAYEVRHGGAIIKLGANIILNNRGGTLFVTKPVREMLFDGYDDPLLDYLKSTGSTAFNIPFDKFGWFVERNGSWTNDGEFNMETGENDIKQLGRLNMWNGAPTTAFYSGGCSKINGTTGELWPPHIDKDKDISLYVSDFCRSFSLAPNEVGLERHGVEGAKWIGDNRVFDNGANYAPNECFCTGSELECPDLRPGVMNISDCRYGAPAFISFPHFYLADPEFSEAFEGLNPRRGDHEFSIALEPSTGIPLEVAARIQVNILLQPISGLALYENVPRLMVPMFWFTQTVALDEERAATARLAILLPKLGSYVAIGFAVLGAILVLVGVTLTLTKSWNRSSSDRFYNEEESDNELNR